MSRDELVIGADKDDDAETVKREEISDGTVETKADMTEEDEEITFSKLLVLKIVLRSVIEGRDFRSSPEIKLADNLLTQLETVLSDSLNPHKPCCSFIREMIQEIWEMCACPVYADEETREDEAEDIDEVTDDPLTAIFDSIPDEINNLDITTIQELFRKCNHLNSIHQAIKTSLLSPSDFHTQYNQAKRDERAQLLKEIILFQKRPTQLNRIFVCDDYQAAMREIRVFFQARSVKDWPLSKSRGRACCCGLFGRKSSGERPLKSKTEMVTVVNPMQAAQETKVDFKR